MAWPAKWKCGRVGRVGNAMGVAVGFVAGIVAAGCARRPLVCAAPGACGPAQICAAGRCVTPGFDPVSSDADRIVVAASEVAVVSVGAAKAQLPDEIALGEGSSPVVLLRFPAPWGNRARIAAAFLTLELQDASRDDGRPITFSVARILEPWSGGDVTWGRLPRLSPPLVTANLRASRRDVRIDVTGLVARWARGQPDEQGIALWASGAGGAGPTYATGALGALGPRLDVYVR
jgi:hypothetical protein